MHIAIASSGLGNVKRGMEGWSSDLSALLHSRGIQVTLFKGAGQPDYSFEKVLPTIKRNSHLAELIGKITRKGGWRFGLGSAVAVETLVFGIQLVKQLRNNRYDLIHLKQGSLARLLRCSKDIGLHKLPIVLSNGQIATDKFLSQFDYIQHLTPCMEKGDCREINESNLPRNRFIIPNFINVDRFCKKEKIVCRRKLKLPQNSIIILSVGTVKKNHKRMDYFINEMSTLKRLTKTPLHFVIAGAEDSETPKIIKMGKEKLGKDITFLLNVPREHMPDIYGASDFFVMCSLIEAFGTAIIEAMACGLQVITHNYPSFKWITKGAGENLDLTKRGGVAKALQRQLQKDNCFRSFSEVSREVVLQNFSEEVIIPKIIDMYQRIIAAENERFS
jgi:glycosyltransferase involved in cell wall biosynthesis